MGKQFQATLVRILVSAVLIAAAARAENFVVHEGVLAAFRAIDATTNGAINADEWQAAGRERFANLDRDHNGILTAAELGNDPLLLETFPHAEDGKNRTLTEVEFETLRAAIFHLADIDHSGYLTFAEFEFLVLLRRIAWRDRSGSDRILPLQLRSALEAGFKLLDQNADGVLSGAELRFFAPGSLKAMDPKTSGRIALEQCYRGYRCLLGFDTSYQTAVPE